ncbi:hypothetical protein BKI52_23145 [marine bacterium AO1-C]|nr:hypothetical protein BKI52_23145 [marine bacterium AO1-C]
MKKNIILLSLIMLPWLAQAQYNRCGIKLPSKNVLEKLKHQHSNRMHSFRSVDEAANYISRIVDEVPDWEQNFVVQERNGINNAYAHISGGRRMITYDNIFVESLDFQAGTKWASISVLAHEVGHHYYDHVLDRRGSTPPKEIEADYFSGYVLAKMGASLSQAKAAMAKLASPYGSSTHPPRNQRLAAIEKGWRDAKPRKKSTMISGNYYSQQQDIDYVNIQQRSTNAVVATWVFNGGQKSSANLQYKRNAYNGAKVYAANYMDNTRRVELYFFKDGRIRERDIDLKTRKSHWYNFSKH